MQAEYQSTRGNGFIISPPQAVSFPQKKPSKTYRFPYSFSRIKLGLRNISDAFFLYTAYSGKRFFTKLLSAFVSLCCTLGFFNFFTFGTGVYFNGEKIAATASDSAFISALSKAESAMESLGISTAELDFSTAPVFSLKTNLLTEEKLCDTILVSGGHFISGCTVYSGNIPIFNAESEDSARKIVDEYISTFSKGDNTSLSAELTYRSRVFAQSELTDKEDSIRLLTDSGCANVISVVSSQTTKILPYETQSKNDASLYVGNTVTISEGKDGAMQISSETVYENGIEKSTRVLSQNITSKPVKKVIKVGTKFKEVLKSGLSYPLKGTLSSPFGGRWGRMHEGIDIAVPEGTPVKAAECGVVSYVSEDAGGYGKFIRIDHGFGVETAYAHLSDIQVSTGQAVSQGAIIALSGNTGRSTGPHLHFEITENGTPVDPLAHLK